MSNRPAHAAAPPAFQGEPVSVDTGWTRCPLS